MSYRINIFYWSRGSSYHPIEVSCDTPTELMELIQGVDVGGGNIGLNKCSGTGEGIMESVKRVASNDVEPNFK